MDKPEFIGRQSLVRTNAIPLDKMLVGFEMPGGKWADAPIEGAVIWYEDGEFAGTVTSSTYSPALGKCVMLGWLYYRDGELPAQVTIDDRTATRVPVPFYDKEASRARA